MLDSEEAAGKDALIAYIKRNAALIANRQRHAPLFVLFDWEASDQDLKKARAGYGAFADRMVDRMNAKHCDPKLSEDFAGIERFYPSKIMEEAHTSGEIIIGMVPGKPFSVAASQLKRAKGQLLSRLRQVKDAVQLRPLISVVGDVDAAIRAGSSLQPLLTGLTP
jgi:hypothetical protein